MSQRGMMAVAVFAALGVTALILKMLFSIAAMAMWLAITGIKLVVFLVLAALVLVAAYFIWKRHSTGHR